MGYMIKTKNGELYHFGVPGMKWAADKLKYGRQLTREEYNKLYAKAHARANGLRANMRGIKRTAQAKGYGQLGAAKALASPYAKRAAAAGKKYGTMAIGAAKAGYGQLGAAKALASPYAKRAAAAGKKYGTMAIGAAKAGYSQARGAAEGYLNKRRATKNAAAANEKGKNYTSEMQRRQMAEHYKKQQDKFAKQREYGQTAYTR